MRKSLESSSSVRTERETLAPGAGGREILIPHAATVLPLTAVRNVFIQASLVGLKLSGHYDRYVERIDPAVLSELLSSLAPGWIPVELATAHYAACDALTLSPEQLNAIGSQVGDRLQEAVLVSSAKRVREADFDMWDAMLSLHRMWARLYQGGSVQVVKLGSREKLIETRGFVLFRFHYYRQTCLAAITAAYRALGAPDACARIVSYSPKTHEMVVRTNW